MPDLLSIALPTLNLVFLAVNVLLVYLNVRNVSSPSLYVRFERLGKEDFLKAGSNLIIGNGGPGAAKDLDFRIKEYPQIQGFVPVLEPQGKEVRYMPLLLQDFLGDDQVQKCAFHVELSYKKYPLIPGWFPRYGPKTKPLVLCFNRAGMSIKCTEH